MRTPSAAVRLIAVVLLIVLTATLATPGRAEADPLTTVAIVGLVIAGVIIIAFLIVANVADRKAEEAQVVWIASARSGPETQSP